MRRIGFVTFAAHLLVVAEVHSASGPSAMGTETPTTTAGTQIDALTADCLNG